MAPLMIPTLLFAGAAMATDYVHFEACNPEALTKHLGYEVRYFYVRREAVINFSKTKERRCTSIRMINGTKIDVVGSIDQTYSKLERE